MPETQDSVHAHEDDLELCVYGRLEPQHTSTLESHLLECKICREHLSRRIGLSLRLNPSGGAKSAEKYERSELRFRTGDRALLRALNPLSMDRHSIKIVDVSKNGLGILAPKSVFPGTIVQVQIQNDVELGEVRYCTASGDGEYRIGLGLHGRF